MNPVPLSDAYLALMTADAAADLYVGRGKTDVPVLLREVERLRAEVAHVTQVREAMTLKILKDATP